MVAAEEETEEVEGDLLPTADRDWLERRGFVYEATLDDKFINVVIEAYSVPAGYDRTESGLLVRLPSTWPDGTPDMFWFEPHLRLAPSGRWPDRADHLRRVGNKLGDRVWQRWSRHLQPGAWRSGVDGLANYLAIVDRALEEAVR
jgi:hypothetical protein